MLGGWKSTALVIAWGFFLGGFTFLAITDFALVANRQWCGNSDTHCFRDWLAALSGWAAFFGATASLPYLVGQWQESRRQTRFIVGDDEPTLDVIEHLDDEDRLVIRIVNWNRRAVFVRDIVTITALPPKFMDETTCIMQVQTQDGVTSTSLPIQINGWEDRSKRPSFARIDIILVREVEGSDHGWLQEETRSFPQDAVISAEIQMLGNVHRVFTRTARAFPDK